MTARKGSFKAALERNEVNQYFRGNGDYFFLDRDWGEHLYGMNMLGIFYDVNEQEISFCFFENTFASFIDSLTDSDEDIEVFWGNAYGFYACLYRSSSKLDQSKFSDIFLFGPCKDSALSYFARAENAKNNGDKEIRAQFPNAAILTLY